MIDLWLLFNLTIPFAEVATYYHLFQTLTLSISTLDRSIYCYKRLLKCYLIFICKYFRHKAVSSTDSTKSLTKVLLQTYIEYLRGLVEDKKTINHHGREREIDLDLMNEKPNQVKPAVTQAFDLE